MPIEKIKEHWMSARIIHLEGHMRGIVGFIGNTDNTTSIGPHAAKMYGQKLNDIRDMVNDALETKERNL